MPSDSDIYLVLLSSVSFCVCSRLLIHEFTGEINGEVNSKYVDELLKLAICHADVFEKKKFLSCRCRLTYMGKALLAQVKVNGEFTYFLLFYFVLHFSLVEYKCETGLSTLGCPYTLYKQ